MAHEDRWSVFVSRARYNRRIQRIQDRYWFIWVTISVIISKPTFWAKRDELKNGDIVERYLRYRISFENDTLKIRAIKLDADMMTFVWVFGFCSRNWSTASSIHCTYHQFLRIEYRSKKYWPSGVPTIFLTQVNTPNKTFGATCWWRIRLQSQTK